MGFARRGRCRRGRALLPHDFTLACARLLAEARHALARVTLPPSECGSRHTLRREGLCRLRVKVRAIGGMFLLHFPSPWAGDSRRRLIAPRRYLASCPVEPGLSSAPKRGGCLADSRGQYRGPCWRRLMLARPTPGFSCRKMTEIMLGSGQVFTLGDVISLRDAVPPTFSNPAP